MNKRDLSERDICTKYITPAVQQAGWDLLTQIREEVGFSKGRIIVRGKLVTRGTAKRADYILYYKPNIPIALVQPQAFSELPMGPSLRLIGLNGFGTHRCLDAPPSNRARPSQI